MNQNVILTKQIILKTIEYIFPKVEVALASKNWDIWPTQISHLRNFPINFVSKDDYAPSKFFHFAPFE
jgi:hypothetical protein